MFENTDDWTKNRKFCTVLPLLVVLNRQGCFIKAPVSVTSNKIGIDLKISQQSANRLLKQAEDLGLITRRITKGGQEIEFTPSAIRQIRQCNVDLTKILTSEEPRAISIEGKVVSGLGDGEYYVSVYSSLFKDYIGWDPHPGTLNIKLATHDDVSKSEEVFRSLPSHIFEEFRTRGRVFGEVLVWKAELYVRDSKEDVLLVRPTRTHHNNMLEIVAKEKIRDKYTLIDDEPIVIRVPLRFASP